MADVRALAESIVLPSNVVITSPLCRPAVAAGVLLATPAMTAPEVDGDDPPTPELFDWTSTPRKGRCPRWTVLEDFPARIWLATLSALLIGIANAWFEIDPNGVLPDAAVFIPITCPVVLTSGPPESPRWRGASV